MADYLARLVDALRLADATSERSLQASIGWSEVSGCRAYLGFRLTGEWASDDTDGWRAECGHILHSGVGDVDALSSRANDKPIDREVETVYRGIPGHADAVDADSVTDYKFPTRAVSESWRNDAAALQQKMIQLQGYAAGLVEAGRLPRDCTVRLLVAPVDGTYDDWWTHEEPFDQAVADAAVERVEEVRELVAQGLTPPRDMPFSWCERFCEFFTICRGAIGAPSDEEITDPELAALVRQYGELGEEIAPKTKLRKQIATEIRGLKGRAGEWRIGLTRPSGMKDVVDMAQVERDYEASGRPLPTREVPTSAPSLQVTRVKE